MGIGQACVGARRFRAARGAKARRGKKATAGSRMQAEKDMHPSPIRRGPEVGVLDQPPGLRALPRQIPERGLCWRAGCLRLNRARWLPIGPTP